MDYVVPNCRITFPSWSVPGRTKWCFPVTILDDNTIEDLEQFNLQLASENPLVAVDGHYSITTIYIKEDENDCKL